MSGFGGGGRGRGGGGRGRGGGGFGGGGGGGYGGGGGGYGGGGGGGGGRGGRRTNREHPTDPEDEQFRKLFIGGLSYETTDESLKSHFEQWGEVVDCVVMKDPNTKRSRGFGFITYSKASEIDSAQANRPHVIDSREVETKRAMPREEGGGSSQQSVKKMFVGGIKDSITEDNLKEVFTEFGEITAIDFIMDKNTGKPKGFCFISYNDHDCVDKAVLKKFHQVNGLQVEVKKATSRENQGGGGGRGGRGARGGGGRGGYQQGFGGSGGYGDGGYGNGYNQGYGGGGGYQQSSGGGYGGGYGGGESWNQSSGGGYDSYGSGGGYGGGQAQSGWGDNFGSNYGSSYGGGPMKGGNYAQRGSGPYGS